MNHRKSYTLYWAGVWLGLFFALMYFLTRWGWVAALSLGVFIAGLLQASIFYRCPLCGKPLNPRTKRAAHCPHCGKNLED